MENIKIGDVNLSEKLEECNNNLHEVAGYCKKFINDLEEVLANTGYMENVHSGEFTMYGEEVVECGDDVYYSISSSAFKNDEWGYCSEEHDGDVIKTVEVIINWVLTLPEEIEVVNKKNNELRDYIKSLIEC